MALVTQQQNAQPEMESMKDLVPMVLASVALVSLTLKDILPTDFTSTRLIHIYF
jgi:hypothetical protein